MAKVKNVSGIIPKKSAVAGKLPTADQLELGELAINFNSDSPFLSTKTSDGTVKKITSEGYVVVDELPASGKSNVIYALETVIVDEDEGTTTYYYDLYIYEQDNWRKIGDTVEALQAGDNITIVNNRINADQVIDITQSDYDNLPASAKTSSAIFNITDKPVLNTDEYQKKLVAGDFISIDAVHNTIDCTLDPNLYVMVNALPAEGVENKIYLLKVVDPDDSTVSFMQYGWINSEWVEYGKTSNLQPNVAGSGITIDSNNAINAKLGNGLTMDANSAITADLGAGLKIDSGKIAPNYAAPIILNASNQLTVSSSSTYTSSGSEIFTRAGAYNMYSSVGKEVTVTYEINTTYVNGVSYCKAYKIFPNLDFYYLGMVVRVKDVPAQTEVTMLNNVKINGKVPANETMKRQSLCGAMQRDTAPCGLIWKAEGENKIYFQPTKAVPSGGDNCVITAFLWAPRTP